MLRKYAISKNIANSSKKFARYLSSSKAKFNLISSFDSIQTSTLTTTSDIEPSKKVIESGPPLVEIFVNDKSIKVPAGSLLIEACTKAGAEIPRFCYHERLAIAGNCRMCLVQLEKSPKPIASCAWPVSAGIRVWTDSEMVKKAREGVMEFLLANHPLDCPICDQGGECDLQDQSAVYGSDRGRFCETSVGKRAVEDKDFGPLVKTTMTRCIHCTRCVRFAVDVAGLDALGTSGRGQDMEIGTYVEKTLLDSELSGNIIDLCPVGALTNKPYAFKARPWELKSTESIDVLDAFGANIRVDSLGIDVMRILPRENDNLNEGWLADKSRFACDGLNRQRLTQPLLRTETNNFIEVSWEKALGVLLYQWDLIKRSEVNPGNAVAAVVGSLADVESMTALKDVMNGLGSNKLYLEGGFGEPYEGFTNHRENYLYNTGIRATEKATSILLIGVNPRKECPLLNVRLRKAYLNGASVGYFGPKDSSFNYPCEHLGESPSDIKSALHDTNSANDSFIEEWRTSSHPLLILGSGLFEEVGTRFVVTEIQKFIYSRVPHLIRTDWNGYNVLQKDASRVGAFDLGFTNSLRHVKECNEHVKLKLIYLLNADNITREDLPEDTFVIYQGHHGDFGASIADLVLPGSAYTEKDATYVNIEGRPQRTKAAVPPPQGARQDWHIIRAISEILSVPLSYDNDPSIRRRIAEIAPHVLATGIIQKKDGQVSFLDNLKARTKADWIPTIEPFKIPIEDYYLADPISRASATMAKCSKAFTKRTL